MWLLRMVVSMVVGAVLSVLLIAILWSPSVRTRIFDGTAHLTASLFGDTKREEKAAAPGVAGLSGFGGFPVFEGIANVLHGNGEKRMEVGRVYRLETGQRLAYLGNGRFAPAEADPEAGHVSARPPAVGAPRSAPVPTNAAKELWPVGSE